MRMPGHDREKAPLRAVIALGLRNKLNLRIGRAFNAHWGYTGHTAIAPSRRLSPPPGSSSAAKLRGSGGLLFYGANLPRLLLLTSPSLHHLFVFCPH